jgi:rubrerythrin
MQTSQQWWDEVKADDAKLVSWLKDQYHGEATASVRITNFLSEFGRHDDAARVIEIIARQEATHALWVGELLEARGVKPAILPKDERYWNETLPAISDFESGCAVAAQAEEMRLERIRVIVADKDTPADIRAVFRKILPQEEFHERAFRKYTTEEALAKTRPNQVKGLEALGLVL